MGDTQQVNFEGTTYHFPADAKDDEILSFLNKSTNPNPPTKYPAGGPVGPQSLARATVGQRDTLLRKTDDPAITPRRVFYNTGHPVMSDQEHRDLPLNLVKGAATGVANASAPVVFHKLLQKQGVMSPRGRMFPGEAKDLGEVQRAGINLAGGMMLGGLEGGLESTPEAGVSSAVRSTAAGEGAVSGTTAASSVESQARPIPVTRAASTLVKEAPTRSVARDVVGLVHGIKSPTAWGLMDAATSVKNILRRFNGGGAAEAAEDTLPHPRAGMGAEAKGTPVDQWGTRIPTPKSATPRSEPAWKSSTSTGTPVESVAPQVTGPGMTADDIQSQLDKVGGRGGKGQTGRAILRKNLKSKLATVEPEGSPRPGTGPGAMLRKGSELGPEMHPGPHTGPGQRLFHGTSEDNAKSIAAEGLRSNAGDNPDYPGAGAAYTSRSKNVAEQWASDHHSDPAVVELEVPKSSIRKATARENDVGADASTGPGFVKHSGEFQGVTSNKTVRPGLVKNILKKKGKK